MLSVSQCLGGSGVEQDGSELEHPRFPLQLTS